MNTPATPNPMMVKKTVDALKEVRASRKDELDELIKVVEQKVEDAHAPKTSPERKRYENRKRAQERKKKGMSNAKIAETMRIAESTVRTLLKPYEPKPHLTQRIEGLEALKSKSNHPAGRGKSNGGE